MTIYKIILFIAGLSQLASPFVTKFRGGSNFNQLLITPAGYTFAIWGVITTLCFSHALIHLFSKNSYKTWFYGALSAVYILFTVWLMVAERSMLWLTLLVFIFMILFLQKVFSEVLHMKNGIHFWEGKLLRTSVGMYLGWSTVAIVLNIGVVVFSGGLSLYSVSGLLFQGLIVAGATLHAIYMLKRFEYNRILFGTFWWAFVGLLVGLFSREGTKALLVWTVLCVIFLNFVYFSKKSKKTF